MAAASPLNSTHKYPLSGLPIARKLTDFQVAEINAIASDAIGSNAEISKMAEEFTQRPYSGDFWDISKYNQWPVFALKSHKLDNLTAFQVATIIFQYAVVSQFAKEMQIFQVELHGLKRVFKPSEPFSRDVEYEWIHIEDNHFKEIIIKLIQANSQKYRKAFSYFFQQDEVVESVVAHIIESLKSEPRSEQYLFMTDGVDDILKHSALLDLFCKKGVPFNGNIEVDGKPKFAIASFSILQSFFNYLRPEFPVKLDPVIGPATTKDISELRKANKRLVSLPFPIKSLDSDYFLRADNFSAGLSIFITHDAIYHAFKISSLLPSENKAVIYLLEPISRYINAAEAEFQKDLASFFLENELDEDTQEIIKKVLNFSVSDISLITACIFLQLNTGASPIDISRLIFVNEDLVNKPDISIDRLNLLKYQSFKIRIAKRFRWLLEDGELWNNLQTNDRNHRVENWIPFFSHDPFLPLFITNPNILKLIIDDMTQNADYWRREFWVNENARQAAETQLMMLESRSNQTKISEMLTSSSP